MDFSRAEARLIASRGSETSMSFLRWAVAGGWVMSSLLLLLRCRLDRSDGNRPVDLVEPGLETEQVSRIEDIQRLLGNSVFDEYRGQNE